MKRYPWREVLITLWTLAWAGHAYGSVPGVLLLVLTGVWLDRVALSWPRRRGPR